MYIRVRFVAYYTAYVWSLIQLETHFLVHQYVYYQYLPFHVKTYSFKQGGAKHICPFRIRLAEIPMSCPDCLLVGVEKRAVGKILHYTNVIWTSWCIIFNCQSDCLWLFVAFLGWQQNNKHSQCLLIPCLGNPQVILGFHSQRVSNTESVSLSCRRHVNAAGQLGLRCWG